MIRSYVSAQQPPAPDSGYATIMPVPVTAPGGATVLPLPGNTGIVPPGTPNSTPPTPVPPQTNPFAGLAATLPDSGFQNDVAKQWLQQALGGQIAPPGTAGGPAVQPGTAPASPASGGLPGWGAPQNPGQSNAPGTTPNGPVIGQPYTFTGDISQDAQKIKKAVKKMRNAKGWSPSDIAKVVGAAALTYVTGGTAAGIAASALASAGGQYQQNKGALKSLHKWNKLKNQYLPQIGWTPNPDGGWNDASGTHMSTAQVAQTLLNLGAFGG